MDRDLTGPASNDNTPRPGPKSAGARFIRADLHVHTHADSVADPTPDLASYIQAAVANGVDVLAITDHNSARFVRDAIKAAASTSLIVLPGIEVSTNDGHLLALFSPANVDALEAFAGPENLRLQALSATEKRSDRSILDLVGEIDRRGGLAIPAHVDMAKGICSTLRQNELTQLLTSPALAGVEFAKPESLEDWFSDHDPDPDRLAAWKARQKDPVLRQRGLARLMSSDAHGAEMVGKDRASRTLTRLRVDDPNFAAIRNAIKLNPKARCKAEAVLPAVYPRILSAEFEGGFLDGVAMDFSPNLNCIIGGRGSGKSTALLSIRAALGGKSLSSEDRDDADRMPEVTQVAYIDSAGSTRLAVRRRGEEPVDESGSPVRLRIADLGQDESGELARGYKTEPRALLRFLDDFLVRYTYDELEADLLIKLRENGAEVTRTSGIASQIKKFENDHATLTASLKAAKDGRVEDIARWEALLGGSSETR